MADHDVDTVIPPPQGGLTGYREAVNLALDRIAHGQVERSWSSASPQGAPSDPLPSDPKWAGEIVYTLNRSAWAPATPEELWKVIDASPVQDRSRVETREPCQLLRLRHRRRAPGSEWLQMRVSPVAGRGSRYDQRAIFYPRGMAGRLYWYGGLPIHRRRFRTTFAEVVAGGRNGDPLRR
jgi:hypothetical protein